MSEVESACQLYQLQVCLPRKVPIPQVAIALQSIEAIFQFSGAEIWMHASVGHDLYLKKRK